MILALGSRTEDITRFFFKQIVDAVAHMHERNIVHLDLKPENILMTEDLTLKVADFGFAT